MCLLERGKADIMVKPFVATAMALSRPVIITRDNLEREDVSSQEQTRRDARNETLLNREESNMRAASLYRQKSPSYKVVEASAVCT